MTTKKTYVWIQKNCRIHDNPALFFRSPNTEVVFIAIIDPKFNRRAPAHYKFYLENLKELENNLGRQINIYHQDTMEVIKQLELIHSEDFLVTHSQFCDWEVKIEELIKSILGERFVTFDSETLTGPLQFPLPLHFTEFRKKIEPTLVDKKIEISNERSQALDHLNEYLWNKKLALTYKETRNQLMGSDYSTKLSKYLSVGSISAKLIFSEIKKFETAFQANESTYWIIFELLWRDFFKHQSRKQKRLLFRPEGYNHYKIKKNEHVSENFFQWCNGLTENNFINAFMIELNTTGYMSNRGRQIVASYLIHDLNCHWRAGASYFESKLIDYDPSLNWGNWAYIAGVGSDPRPVRKFNIDKQLLEHDPNGEFVRYWLKKNLH
jgi:deoxyribodipyrimidine photo-lyase